MVSLVHARGRLPSASTRRRDEGVNERSRGVAAFMPPLLLVKLWIAKKLAVMLAVRAFGVKRLYRRGLRLTRFAYGTNVEATSRRYAEKFMRKTCWAAMKTEEFVVKRAVGFTERAFASAGFSKRGMPSSNPSGFGPPPAGPARARESSERGEKKDA